MAELERFELSNGFHHYTLSKRAPSTARTQLQETKTLFLSYLVFIRQLILGLIGYSTLFEKLGEKSGTFKVLNSAHDGELMIKPLILVKMIAQTQSSSLDIICPKDT